MSGDFLFMAGWNRFRDLPKMFPRQKAFSVRCGKYCSPTAIGLEFCWDRTGVLCGPDWHSIRRESGLDQLDCSVEVAYFCHELCNFKIMLMLKSRLSLGKLAGFLCLLSCFTSLGAQEQAGSLEKPGWKLVWNDEFNYVGLPDPSKWSYDTDGNSYGWGNNELQYYTEKRKENAWVENGHLTIRALKEEMGGKSYTSARLRTKDKGDWLYGRFEIRAKLPTGRGTWPAIWMLPTDWEYGGWPASGEIDIMENVGFDPDTIVGTVHTKSFNHSIGTQKGKRIYCPDCYSAFHVYTLEWEKEECRIYLDDQLYFTFKNDHQGFESWPFDKRFHLLLNLAVGGNWGGAQGVDDSIFPLSYEIDYVRVYQRK